MVTIQRLTLTAALGGTLLSAGDAIAQSRSNSQDFWHMGDWGWRHMMFGGGFLMVLFWIVVIGVGILVIWSVRRRGGGLSFPDKSAVQILEERFARGEIDEAEFRQRRELLERKDDRT